MLAAVNVKKVKVSPRPQRGSREMPCSALAKSSLKVESEVRKWPTDDFARFISC
jgi:hypothetical protein